MEKKQVSNVTVNDGNGLYDNDGLLESLINDCNNIVKDMASGNYVGFCGVIVQMIQKITNLRRSIKRDLEAKDEQIEEIKAMNNSLVEQITGLPVDNNQERDGVE